MFNRDRIGLLLVIAVLASLISSLIWMIDTLGQRLSHLFP